MLSTVCGRDALRQLSESEWVNVYCLPFSRPQSPEAGSEAFSVGVQDDLGAHSSQSKHSS